MRANPKTQAMPSETISLMKTRSLISLLCLLLCSCSSWLPPLEERTESRHFNTSKPVRLDNILQIRHTPHTNGLSDIYLLNDPHEAFAARAALIESAEHSLDLQYYIWRNDISGRLLFNLVYLAAERGVRVRLLLDDNNTRGLDDLLLALDSHPNIEVRLFNPFVLRKWRALGYLTDFPRLNRRMHNKSFTADNRATILGGRNIGDEYFKVGEDTVFADLDILATGSVVGEVSHDFDRYWASHSAHNATRIIRSGNIGKGLQALGYNDETSRHALLRYRETVEQSPLYQKIQAGRIDWQSVQTRLISDDPAKGLDRDRRKPRIAGRLQDALKQPEKSVYLVSPYFVPTKSGTDALAKLVQDGIDVTVLTNSLQATDVAAVHSGYVKYRKPLLKAGIKLYELQPNHAVPATKDKGLTGSSVTSLHAKTFIVDGKRIFIGSFNLDPRSARLNTEMGVVIESPKIAEQMERTLADTTPEYAYRVTLDRHNRLQWHDPATRKTYPNEPEAKLWKRIAAKILSLLPIESLL